MQKKLVFKYDGNTIYDLLPQINLDGYRFDFPCGGKKTCRKCKVKIIDGFEFLSEPDETERKFLSEKEIRENIRYACMCGISGDVTVELNPEIITDKIQVQTEGLQSKNISPDKFMKITVNLANPTLDNPISDEKNLVEAVNRRLNIETNDIIKLPFGIMRKLSELNSEKNKENKKIDVILSRSNDGIKIIDVREASQSDKCEDIYGAAVDIGTTTAAVYLYSLTTGDLIGVAAEENPQRIYGADVISRINYIIENENGLDNLKTLILSLVFKLIKNLCGENNINQENIYSIVLTGNTVMQHIIAGLSPKNIAFTPFAAATLFGFDVTLGEITGQSPVGVADSPFQKGALGTGVNPEAVIYFPPAFASYVGGDIATGIIASDTDLRDNLRLFLDIGTNGEIGLGDKNSLAFCATAAGPAFEGAHIKLGMAGVKGAINNIYLDEFNNIICGTIGNIKPKGLCGSGIIDAVALMLELGVLEDTGRILESDEIEDIDWIPEQYKKFAGNLSEIDGENVFVLDFKNNIYITQKDIREIQLAKASVSAGIMTLLNYCNKKIPDVSELILAGGFGAHINKKSACRIGLIPKELEDKIIIAGNTAGMGAAAVLLDTSARGRINKISGISEYIELSGDAFFMDEYIDRMMF